MKRLFAIGFIWLGCALAWVVLGSTITYRGGNTRHALTEEVRLLWGPPIAQAPPHAIAQSDPAGDTVEQVAVPLEGSNIDVGLKLEQRRKGLMWFATYAVDFAATYQFKNPSKRTAKVSIFFPLVGENLVYDRFKVLDGRSKPVDVTIANGRATWDTELEPEGIARYRVVYRSRGTSSWTYRAGHNTARIKNFRMAVHTNFAQVDFPAGTLSASNHHLDGDGWRGEWSFDSLISTAPIGIELPKRLNPGPLAAKITYFAPVGLLFFFFVVAILAAARRKDIHPMNYFFLGCSFFAFHLLFAYLVDHLSVFPSFTISTLVSVALATSYARLFVGWRFALLEIGVAQLIYLVLFSFTFFWKGFTGLSITIGAISTLMVIMQITGRMDWAQAGRILRKAESTAGP